MKFIVGLGNPGEKYAKTRHNIGFSIVDFYRDHHKDNFSIFQKKEAFSAEVAEGVINGEKIFLIKPETFMNESGRAVETILRYYQGTIADLIVIQDDSDLFIGRIKIKKGGQSAGHKGISSIIKTFGEEDFIRILFGIRDEKTDRGKQALSFVLKLFPSNKAELIFTSKQTVCEALDFFLATKDFAQTQNKYNLRCAACFTEGKNDHSRLQGKTNSQR